jgi:glycine oxidase
VKSWDVIVVGGGIIGLSLSIELHKRGAKVLVVERGEPGREASSAAGGMLVDCSTETPPALRPLATASARMYPEFAHEMQVESGVNVDLREHGAIVFPSPDTADAQPELASASLLPAPLGELEPALAETDRPAFFISET